MDSVFAACGYPGSEREGGMMLVVYALVPVVLVLMGFVALLAPDFAARF